MAAATGAIIAGAATLAGGATSAYAQGKTNKKTREWNEKMYGIQRKDALADWNMQNEYNSPAAQMGRLREAGLNPNLVYGNGADAQAGAIRSTETKGWNPTAPTLDLGAVANSAMGAMLQYQSLKKGEAETNNLQAQNTVLQQEAALKAAQIANVNAQTTNYGANTKSIETSTERAKFGLSQDIRLADISAEAAAANLRKTIIDTQVTLNADERAAALNSSNIREAAERILTMQLQRTKVPLEKEQLQVAIENMRKDGSVKALEEKMANDGVLKNHPLWMQMVYKLIETFKLKEPAKKFFDESKK